MEEKIDIVVIGRNEAEHLARSLESVRKALQRLKEQLQIGGRLLYVDSHSSDRSVEIAREKRAEVIFSPRRFSTPANGRMTGLLVSSNPYIMFLDGDMEMDVEIRPVGAQVQRESTTGKFRVLRETMGAVVIETTEKLPSGGTQTNQVEYRLQDDGQLAVMSAPTSAELSDCDPLFVFQRVDDPDAQVAEQNLPDTSKK